MLLRVPDSGSKTMVFHRAADVEELYASGTVGQSNWVVTVALGATYGTANLATGLTQSAAESLSREVAIALGIAWE